jgi:trehalose 6-phosphate phosphatase
MVLEVRPPVKIDKGRGIASFLEGSDIEAAMYVGDDATDLDAFRMLSQLVDEGRLSNGVKVGVRSEEGPEEIVSDADLVVDGTDGVLELLSLLVSD